MEQQQVFTSLTAAQLMDLIRAAMAETHETRSFGGHSNQPQVEYLTRQEVCDLLRVSLPTLRNFTITGQLTRRKVGGRVLFRKDEVLKFAESKKRRN